MRATRLVTFLLPALFVCAGCAAVRSAEDDVRAVGAVRPPLVREETFDFDGPRLPEALRSLDSGEPGRPGEWTLERAAPDDGTLVQTSRDPVNGRFPMLVYEDLLARDVDVWVRFEPVSGRVDQAAGIAFRIQDRDNYYVARANALESDVRLFKVVAGERIELAQADVDVSRDRWHVLKVSARGNRIDVALDGAGRIGVEDATFSRAGRVGLWTKADSVTRFDTFKIEAYDRP